MQVFGEDPFALFDDARGGGPARLFARPREIVTADAPEEVAPALEKLRRGLAAGLYAAGWLAYEAGHALEPRLAARAGRGCALLRFGLFDHMEIVPAERLAELLPDPNGAWISPARPRMARAAYDDAFDLTQRYLRAGDIYQLNLSYRADVTVLGHPLAAYARLRKAGGGAWGGVVHDGADWLISTSPELFFKLSGGVIEARPMKGTAQRGADAAADKAAMARLRSDPKEIAENLMIVDLLRNDISRVAKPGSVRVPALFTVETYPTVHALTSTICGELLDGRDALDAIAALFPCGSITGVPKIRAMEVIDELEVGKRGAYTGSMGWISPDGEAEFNVAIRTLSISGGRAEIGLGSGVVLDSTAEGEWRECAAKGAFLTAGAPCFDLFETMRFEPESGVARLELHLARLQRSAAALGFAFDEAALRATIAQAHPAQVCVMRLSLSVDGKARIETRALPPAPAGAALVGAAPLPVRADDFRLRHKTSLRGFYEEARRAVDTFDTLFVDADGFVTEGTFTNVFVERNGALVTPALSRGLLPGVLRAELLAAGRAREGDVRVSDLERDFFLGNAVRGLIPARLAQKKNGAEDGPGAAQSFSLSRGA